MAPAGTKAGMSPVTEGAGLFTFVPLLVALLHGERKSVVVTQSTSQKHPNLVIPIVSPVGLGANAGVLRSNGRSEVSECLAKQSLTTRSAYFEPEPVHARHDAVKSLRGSMDGDRTVAELFPNS
jgi:hypothetical protein